MYPKRSQNIFQRLDSYRDRRARAVIKTLYYWLFHMSRSDRRSWSERGIEIKAKIGKARTLALMDKREIDRLIDHHIDRQEAREIISKWQGGTFDDDSS